MRAAIIPILAIPVSLIGAFAAMSAIGFSLNNLSLFGLVLAIGIVVDDAIVVVENIERNLERGMDPIQAARLTMQEVGTALVSIALVLMAVFVPTAFLGGITGEFFRQFGVTIAAATIISAFNSLTLSPALGAILLRPRRETNPQRSPMWRRLARLPLRGFDHGLSWAARIYGVAAARTIAAPWIAAAMLAVIAAAGALLFERVPGGFIPQQDQGYVIVAVELPKGASLGRTDLVVQAADRVIRTIAGVADVVEIVGFSGATFSSASNAAALFVVLDPFERRRQDNSAPAVVARLRGELAQFREAQFFVIDPPPVRGLGTGGGFKMMLQDRAGAGLGALEQATIGMMSAAANAPEVERVFSTFTTSTPRFFLDIDRTRVEMLDLPVANIFQALQINLGSAYVNDFNLFGRPYRVTTQADSRYRMEPDDILRLRARARTGAMVPLGSVMSVRRSSGPERIVRHNLYPATELQGGAAPGRSSSEAQGAMARLAHTHLPPGFAFEWTEIALQGQRVGNAAVLIFPLSVLFVFLVLTAQYESWVLPIAIILIVPLAIVFALVGVWLRGMDNNLLTQIGIVVLIGLACKNAILIVEFAKQQEDQGKSPAEAALEAAQLRFRPTLMTSFAFILGVIPLMVEGGAGAEMRRALGTTVFAGMLGVMVLQSAVLALQACAVGPTYHRPQTVPEAAFAALQSPYLIAEPETQWWRALSDPVLNDLISRAFEQNHDVRIARANILAARALLGERRQDRLPTGAARASTTAERASAATAPADADTSHTFYSAGFDAVWELDFFGRIRRTIEAQAAEYEAAIADRHSVLITLAAEVCRTYLELRGAQHRLDVARRNAENQRETYALAVAVLDGGRGTDFDVARAETQFQSTLAVIEPLEAEVSRAIHRLGVLLGREPTALTRNLSQAASIPHPPGQIEIGDPALLLRRRPDIQSAERRLAASTAGIGIATAELFPRVGVAGAVGILSTVSSGPTEGAAFAIGPFLSWPVFDLGRVRARIRRAEAGAEAHLARYERTVLIALEEAETALVAYARARTRQAHLQTAAAASERAANLARIRYRFGVDSFLSVLDAERTLLETQDQFAASAVNSAIAFVALQKALGGGWEAAVAIP